MKRRSINKETTKIFLFVKRIFTRNVSSLVSAICPQLKRKCRNYSRRKPPQKKITAEELKTNINQYQPDNKSALFKSDSSDIVIGLPHEIV